MTRFYSEVNFFTLSRKADSNARDELGHSSFDDLVAPLADIDEMDPVCRSTRPVRMRKVAVQDQLMSCLSAVTELRPVHIPVSEQAVEPVREGLFVGRQGRSMVGYHCL
jgi:hypothetical protein